MKDFRTEKIRALSWKQPFAQLMLHGKIETRTWNTNYRGLVLICASKKGNSEKDVIEISGGLDQYKRINLKLYPAFASYSEKLKQRFGKAIAIGRLVDCRPMKKEDEDKCFVEYQPDLYCHIYEDVKAIKPFEWKGTQGWKTLEQSVVDSIEII